ncbi:hypothetical protein I302_104817 [Kwoniella bestiolae CBS 10118]|uniref:3'-5' exonuclease domain-containing protein n=1 Tax=Kwoniella bestiolae CBS 10118 TaxID=1296100 RepID=A0A1B9FRP0_9TREE|nr:hypothetical protein I302_09114 [Kwoniella bestiolae CBS 10118]OCF21435.1 hypothetical protein I302_09114 [Kwoniella bestiolae CBS 10118]
MSSDGIIPSKKSKGILEDLNLDLEVGIGKWEGKAVFTKEPLYIRSIRPNAPKTPKTSQPSGSSTSPISISSTPSPSPQTLSRPRAVPHFTSPLPRTTAIPTATPSSSKTPFSSRRGTTEPPPTQTFGITQPPKPIHPFFNRTRTAPPTSQPRYTAHYSSTEASSTQPSQESQTTSASSSRAPSTLDHNRDRELDLLAEEVGKLHFDYGYGRVPASSASQNKNNTINSSGQRTGDAHDKSKSKIEETTPSDVESSTGVSFRQISSNGKLQSKSTVIPSQLPMFHYDQYSPKPQIAYTSSTDEANDLLGCLKGDVLGFDLEWPPGGKYKVTQPDGSVKTVRIGMTWSKEKGGYVFGQGRTALMQFCDERLVVLVHLGEKMDIPSKAIEILRSPKIYKLGVQVRGDGQKLLRDFPQHFTPSTSACSSSETIPYEVGIKGLLELSYLARGVDPIGTGPGSTLIGLAALSQRYLRKQLDKSNDVRKGNWVEVLDQKQKDYAANDVYASLQIYKSLRRMAQENNFEVNLDRYLSNVDGSVPIPRPATGDNGEAVMRTELEIGERIITLGEGVKPPSPAQLGALSDFVKGTRIDKIATNKGIKVATAEGYICSALQVVGADFLTDEERRRLWEEIPRDTYTWKRNRELYNVLKKEFDSEAGSESETANDV